MNNINIKEIIKKISILIDQKNFAAAKSELKNLEKNPNKEINLTFEGLIELKSKNYLKSINFFKSAIDTNKQYIIAYVYISDAYQKIKDFLNAEKYLSSAIRLFPQSDVLYNALGYNLFQQDKIKESILHFEKSISFNLKNFRAHFNLGNSYYKLKNFERAKNYFYKVIEINKNCPDVFFNLAECEKKLKNYESALFNYKIAQQEKTSWLRKEKIIAKILESYLILNKRSEYEYEIQDIMKSTLDNRRIAATSSFISHQFNIENLYPFCPNPFQFIYKKSLKKYEENYKFFLDSLFVEISNELFDWQPSGKTTRNGYGTTGNLSEKKLPILSTLEKYILLELENYYSKFKDENITFIKNWPSSFKFVSWSNRLKKQGYNISHIHPGGWISGVFYLKIPKNIKDKEAGIEFSLHGDDYFISNNEIPTKLFHPLEGDIILFPSSLFHKTIPFESNEERVCIAFDLCKV